VLSFALFISVLLALASPPPAIAPAAVAAATTAATATPCPTSSPGSAVRPAPTPCPTSAPALQEIGRVTAPGRATNLVGSAAAASAGTINADQIADRPLLRPGEILEEIPGLVISQHSGEGKANQYYLRGFQLDHGTDLAATIDGIPINMPTHAHGQGYSDINWLMPELVSFVSYKKGPYDAGEGDFSTAGSYDLYYRNTIAPTASFGFGDYGYGRVFVAGSPRLGSGNLLYAVELYRDNGTFDRPDDYQKANGVLRWSTTMPTSFFAVTLQGYRGDFSSTDQIPQRLVDAGVINRFGYIDPTDGGRTFRYALSTEWEHDDPNGKTRLEAYGLSYGLQLFSDFTYYQDDANDYYNVTANPLTCNPVYTTCTPGTQHISTYASYCPANTTPTNGSTTARSVVPNAFGFSCGDQREQADQRFVSGFKLAREMQTGKAETTVGAGLRNDNIYTLQLLLSHDQVPYANGTLSNDRVLERDMFLYAQTEYHLSPKFRLSGGLREDVYNFRIDDVQSANSGYRTEAMLNPKFTAAYAASDHQEFYLDFGDSFHSNDGRGTTQTLDPQTHAAVDPQGEKVVQYAPLVRAWGEELGYRFSSPKLTTTVAFWRLNIASELVFDGDQGVTAPSGPTERKGIELTNYYRATRTLTFDTDIATSTARFTTNPGNLGTFVPESLNVVTSAGVTLDQPAFAASVRYRYFGPRVLDQLGDAVSSPTNLVNAQLTWKLRNRRRVTLELLNLLNSAGDDVEYYYGSWLPEDAKNPAYTGNPTINPLLGGTGVNDYHFHPMESRIARLVYSVPI
jgi:outer membrane receptor for Fe3+-dicitrate